MRPGIRADVVIPECRQYAQAAVATLQLLLICTRGHRAYTSQELDTIFRDVGTEFFRNLEQMTQKLAQKRCERQQEAHLRDPVKFRAPVPWNRDTRDKPRCLQHDFCVL